MFKKSPIIVGTFILTATGFITRIIGFFFRIFLSHTFGEEQMGLYQLIFPIYALCFSLSSAGIETALSRCVARRISMARSDDADRLLYQSTGISLSISLLLGIIIRHYSSTIAIYILGDLRCEPLLSIISYALPFASIHSCIVGYYLGKKQTRVPAFSQFLEQVARVGSIYIICHFALNTHRSISIGVAVIGIVIGEIASMIYCLRTYCSEDHVRFSFRGNRCLGKELLSLALPLTSSRVLMNLFQSVETISIPICLQTYGCTNSEALSIYGVLSGMVLPCILFPTAVTNSVSTMLLPTVAEIQASGTSDNFVRLKNLIQKVVFFGVGLGTICGICFLLFGSFIGNILFDSPMAGEFIRTLAWICPFMYMNSTLISILNGLGKANRSFAINILGLFVRIVGVWIGIPMFGMKGYLWGLLGSQLIVSFMCIVTIFRYVRR